MSYSWITKFNSPNFTLAKDVPKVWGRSRTIEAIAIHWWDDPAKKPSFEGVIATLTNPARGASAHIVATGTGRKAACLVNLADASWATNQANPYTISIECDPRCRTEDYDVIAEVIAQIRQVYGNLPLVPHKKFVATACPGNYDLAKLDKLAKTKLAKPEWDWGHVTNKPVVTTKEVTVTEVIPFQKDTRNTDELLVGQTKIQTVGVNGVKTFTYTVTYTDGKETKRVLSSTRITKPSVTEITLVGTGAPTPEPVTPVEPTPEPIVTPPVVVEPVEPSNPTTVIEDITRWAKWLAELIKSLFTALRK